MLFAISAAGFTAASLLCGPSTIDRRDDRLARAAGLHRRRHDPDRLRRRLHDLPALAQAPSISPMIGLVATLAPTIGPTVGGYLTERSPGTGCSSSTSCPASWSRSRRSADRLRQARLSAVRAISTGRACSRWRPSSARSNTCWRRARATTGSRTTTVFCAGDRSRRLGASCSSGACFTAQEPIVDLRAFTDRNFALGSLFSFVLGIGLYGLTYLYPVYLGAGPRLRRADDRRDACSSPASRCSSPRRSPAG